MTSHTSGWIKSNVLGLVAIFIALSGSAYAVQANSVGTKQLKAKAVKTGKIGPGAVKTGKLGPEAVKAGRIANGAVATAKLADGAVSAEKLAEGVAVEGAQGPSGPQGAQGPPGPSTGPAGGSLAGSYPNPTIANGAVRAASLGPITTVSSTLLVLIGTSETGTATCPSGSRVISGGGGFVSTVSGLAVTNSRRDGNGWNLTVRNASAGDRIASVEAYCLAL